MIDTPRAGASWRRAAAAVAVAACLLSGPANRAAAASPAEVVALQAAPCPAYKALRRLTYTPGEEQAALNGDFDVLLGYHVNLVPPVDWSQDPYDAVSWVLALHSFKWIDPLIYTYRQGGIESLTALAHARDLVLDWMAANPYPSGGAWSIASHTKASGDRLGYFGYIARAAACRGLLTDAGASTMLDSLAAHAAYLVDPANLPKGDHKMYMSYGLALLSRYLNFLPAHRRWLIAARRHFRAPVRRRTQMKEGVWLVNSPIYAATVINVIHRWLADVGGNPFLARVRRHLRHTLGWFVLPDGGLAPWGDDPAVERPPGWVPKLAHEHSGLHVMRRSGYAVVKKRRSYLGVISSFHHSVHKHRDDLSFELYDHGRRIVTDTGMFHYDRDPWLRFSRSARAHSVLTVDRRGFAVLNWRHEYGSGILASGQGHGWYAILATNPLALYHGVLHKRLFLYKPGAALLIVDTVRSHRSHVYGRYFQLGPTLDETRAHHGLRLAAHNFRGSLRSPGSRAKLRTMKGRTHPIAGWSFPSFRIKVPRLTAVYASRARRANYLSELGLHGAGSPHAHLLHAGSRRVRLRLAGRRGRFLLSVSRHRGSLELGLTRGARRARRHG